MDAALLMSKTGSLFHCLGKAIADPGRLLGALNVELCELNVRGMFVTMIAGVFDPETGQVSLSNAGHPPALLLDRHGRARQVAAGAPPLGVMPGCRFPAEHHALAGHTLYLYSDGLMEAAEARHRSHGADAVLALLRRLERAPPLQRPARLVNALARAGQAPDDDLTVLVVDGTAAG